MYARPRILIVDYDVDNCEMLPIWLDRHQNKYEITTTYTCREARDLTVRNRFDLYIFDYLMPDMTGASLARSIREMDPSAPIIIYTGLATAEAENAALSGGADFFFLKPNDLDRLRIAVDSLLKNRVIHSVPNRPRRMNASSII